MIIPPIVTKHILEFVQDDCDKISFYLTCKQNYNNHKQSLIATNSLTFRYYDELDKFQSEKIENNNNNNNRQLFYRESVSFSLSSKSNSRFTEFNFTSNVEVLEIPDCHSIERLPSTVKVLYLLPTVSVDPIPAGYIPCSVTRLILHVKHPVKVSLEPGSIPMSVEILSIDHQLLRRDYRHIPPSVKELIIDNFSYMSKKDDGGVVVPDTVEKLTISGICLDTVSSGNGGSPIGMGSLPSTLLDLDLGMYFYQFPLPIQPGVLPSSLKTLHIGQHFNQPLEYGVIPEDVENLDLGFFNRPILPIEDHYNDETNSAVYPIPSTLKSLKIGRLFSHQLSFLQSLTCLTTLTLGVRCIPPIIIPTTVTKLDWHPPDLDLLVIPPSIRHLKIHNSVINVLEDNNNNSVGTKIHFPELISLELLVNYRRVDEIQLLKKIISISSTTTITHLTINAYNQIPIGLIPNTVKYLNLGQDYNHPIPKGVLPRSSLETLIISDILKQSVVVIPKSVIYLNIIPQGRGVNRLTKSPLSSTLLDLLLI
eukprot:gene5168-6433_t